MTYTSGSEIQILKFENSINEVW